MLYFFILLVKGAEKNVARTQPVISVADNWIRSRRTVLVRTENIFNQLDPEPYSSAADPDQTF